MPSKEILRRNRICIVPACRAVNSDYPDRIFFPVPETKKYEWLGIVGANSSSIKANQRLYCCEKHFDVKRFVVRMVINYVRCKLKIILYDLKVQRDIEGYYFYKHFGGRIKLEDHAYPYKNLGDNVTVSAPQVSKRFAEFH